MLRKPDSEVRPGGRKGGVGLSLYSLVLLAMVGGVLSGRAAIQFDVFLGYDSLVPEGCWFPIVCEVKNDGPAFKGRIEVSLSTLGQDQSRQTEVELPTGTLKRLVLPVFSGARSSDSWDVRLLDERGKVRAEQTSLRPRKQLGAESLLVGALTRTAGGVPVFPTASSSSPQQFEPTAVAARLVAQLVPDNPLVLDGLDALYLSSERAPELTDNQVRALFTWLNAGGHLIVGVEQLTDVTGTPWLKNVFPCDLKDMQLIRRHPELQEWVRKTAAHANPDTTLIPGPGRPGRHPRAGVPGNPDGSVNLPAEVGDDSNFEAAEILVAGATLRDGQVEVAIGDAPLIVTANRGRGRVTVLLFSPEREPFRSWKNLPAFWAKLTGAPPLSAPAMPNYYAGNSWTSDGVFGAMIESRQVHKLPVGWLLLLLIVYLVVIGPLDQFWLKRIGRPMLTWITFPCYVVLFSLVIYLIGYKLRAGESEWNELHVVDVLPTGDHAQLKGQTYMSVYSPANQRYALEGQQEFATFRGEVVSFINRNASAERANVVQHGDNFKAEIFVPVWTSQLFVSDWLQPAASPLVATVTAQGGGWQVTLENRTERSLTNLTLAIASTVLWLGDVPAGQTKTFTASKDQGVFLPDYVSKYGASFQSAVQSRNRAFGSSESGHIGDLPNSTIAASFLSQLGQSDAYQRNFLAPPGLDLTSVVQHGNAVLFAWAADYSPIGPMNLFTVKRSHRNTLWRLAVPVK